MACSKPKKVSMKRLVQLLEEQQEPFTLEVYLSERSYMRKSLSSESNDCKIENSVKNWNRSHSHKAKRRIRTPKGSGILRLAINKLISYKNCQKLEHCKHRVQKDRGKQAPGTAKKNQHTAVRNQLSSSSSMTSLHSSLEESAEVSFPCPEQNHGLPSQSTFEAFKLQNPRELQVATNTKLQRGYMEGGKQLSLVSANTKLQLEYEEDGKQLRPVSVREEPPAAKVEHFLRAKGEETTSISSITVPRKAKEDSISSAYMCKLLVQSLTEKHNRVNKTELQDARSGLPQYQKLQEVSMQTKQLLFDCAKEVINSPGRQGSIREVLGPEELGEVICDQICSWENLYGDVQNTHKPIDLDYTTVKWRNFQLVNEDLGIEIAEVILDDIVSETINFEAYGY